jgi:predicted O-methyltransferase YrrM
MLHRLRRDWRFIRAYVGMEQFKQKADSHLNQPEELVKLVFGYAGSAIKPIQIDKELAALVRDVRDLNPATVLEIGTAQGGTLFLWSRLAQPNATIVSIDLPGGKFGGGYTNRRAVLYRRFPAKSQQLHLLREDSHALPTFQKAKQLFSGKPVDLLFVDGDHTYEGVKKDWEMYSELVRPGGMIVFHDIAGNYDDTQVKKLWDSIKSNYKHNEYAVHPDGLYGIGVLSKANS